jgi:hypothetical protein
VARPKKVRVIVALAIVALSSVAFGSLRTEARTRTVKSTVEFTVASATSFSGTVTSNDGACLANRTVKVKEEGKGANKTVGTATTDANGNWGPIANTHGPGRFFARVKKLKTSGYGYSGKLICKQDRSRATTVPA